MFRKVRHHQRSQESHCGGDSSSWCCFDVKEGSSGCCPREGRHGLASGGLCAHSLLLEAGHPLAEAQCVGCPVMGSPSEWRCRWWEVQRAAFQ